jgi:peptidoglycan/LPS O-acetylase OafA/YrhL
MSRRVYSFAICVSCAGQTPAQKQMTSVTSAQAQAAEAAAKGVRAEPRPNTPVEVFWAVAVTAVALTIIGIFVGYAANVDHALVALAWTIGILAFCQLLGMLDHPQIVKLGVLPPQLCSKIATAFCPLNNTLGLWRRPGSNLAPLDGVRALAVLWVMAYHLAGSLSLFFSLGTKNFDSMLSKPPMQFLQNGDMGQLHHSGTPRQRPLAHSSFFSSGVDLFFALSGFLIMHLLVKDVKRRKR